MGRRPPLDGVPAGRSLRRQREDLTPRSTSRPCGVNSVYSGDPHRVSEKTMTTSRERQPFSDLVAPAPSVDQFIEAKLHRPRRRDSWVHRDRLVEALDRAVTHPVTLVAAPAGYGKTTALAQWLDRPGGPATAWVSLDPGDNDPDRLWSHVVVALERAGCVLPVSEPARVVGATSATTPRAVLPALLNALAAMPDDIVLVLDDFHFVQSPACHEQVQFLIAGLPAQAHLVIATRSDPGQLCFQQCGHRLVFTVRLVNVFGRSGGHLQARPFLSERTGNGVQRKRLLSVPREIELRLNPPKSYVALSYFGYLTGIVGTAVWGYGDVLLRLNVLQPATSMA